MTVELELNLAKSLSDFALTLGIYSATEIKCFETSIPSITTTFGPLNKHGCLSCYVPELPLLPGLYYINVGLYPINWDYVYDYHWEMHALHVVSKDGTPSEISGVVLVRPVWSVLKRG